MPTRCKFKLENDVKCGKDASYGNGKREYCPKHGKELNLPCAKIDSRMCKTCKQTRGSFKDAEGNHFCEKCSVGHETKTIGKKCVSCNLISPSFGIDKATHCASCKTTGMRDYVSNLCDCGKNATFGLSQGKPTHCKSCKSTEMRDVKNIRCELCTKQPTFGVMDGRTTRCKTHKTEEMIDLKHDTELCSECVELGDIRRASYGIDKLVACIVHKTEEMKDLTSRMCANCNEVQPVFGYTKDELFCLRCKAEDMRDVKNKMCKCNAHQPHYNYPNEKIPICCNDCKEFGMIDIVNPRCKGCNIYYVTQNEYCVYCSDSPYQKKFEKEVYDFLTENEYEFVFNKSVSSKLRFRPDFLFTFDTHTLIVEVDEYQHNSYDVDEEVSRMECIQTELDQNCIFIRYNPNSFKIKGKTKRPSNRLETLRETIEDCKKDPEMKLKVIKLFYTEE